ncbi:MAG: FHA domain-containing protein [bacterium]
MPKLLVKKKAEVITEFHINNTRASVTIGSDSSNDIVIVDKLISDKHVQVEYQMNRYFARDMNSAFGTVLNGKRLDRTSELKDGDLLQIGEHYIVFENPLPQVDAAFFETSSSSENHSQKEEMEVIPQTTQAKIHALAEAIGRGSGVTEHDSSKGDWAPYYLTAIYGPYRGKRYQLRYGETKIGRDENLNDIILKQNSDGKNDQSISRRHATISFRNNSFYVTDKRSKTRTLVNQIVVPEDGEIQLYPNDEIEIVSDQHSTIFRFAEEHKGDFSPPKKAGVWSIRYRSKFVAAAAVLALIAGLFFAARGFLERSVITQKPNPLTLELAHWTTDRGLSSLLENRGNMELELSGHQVPVIADFNGDGFVDIVTTNVTHKPLLIDGQSKLPNWIIDTMPADVRSPFIASDINQDDFNDLLYLSQDGRVVAIDGVNGAEIWTSPFFTEALVGPPVVADFDGDGINDVAIADENGTIHLGYNRLLSMEWQLVETDIPMKTVLTSVDLDSDRDFEIIAGSERGLVLFIDGVSGQIIETIDVNEELNRARGTFYEDNQIRNPIAVADMDSDGKGEFVISTVQGKLLVINGASRERMWHEVFADTVAVTEDFTFPFALGDFDGDGQNDVAIASALGEMRAYKGSGKDKNPVLIWRMGLPASIRIQNGFSVSDITKDHISDILFVDTAGMLNIIDGRTGTRVLTENHPAPERASVPLIADLQKDGTLDIFLSSESGVVFQYISNCQVPKSSILWGQRYAQAQNSVKQCIQIQHTMKADISMALGIFMFLGAGIMTFLLRRKKLT